MTSTAKEIGILNGKVNFFTILWCGRSLFRHQQVNYVWASTSSLLVSSPRESTETEAQKILKLRISPTNMRNRKSRNQWVILHPAQSDMIRVMKIVSRETFTMDDQLGNLCSDNFGILSVLQSMPLVWQESLRHWPISRDE